MIADGTVAESGMLGAVTEPDLAVAALADRLDCCGQYATPYCLCPGLPCHVRFCPLTVLSFDCDPNPASGRLARGAGLATPPVLDHALVLAGDHVEYFLREIVVGQ